MTKKSKFQHGRFCAWDSEGIDLDGGHVTVCLGNSDFQVLQDTDGLRTREMLDFICDELARKPDAIHVAFAFGYDVNMILRDLPRSLISELWNDTRVTWKLLTARYEMHYVPRKVFGVWRIDHYGNKSGGYIWDTFGFFQSSFVAACKSYGELEALEQIARMKEKRSLFAADDLPEMIGYMFSECETLVRIMDKLRSYLNAADLRVSRWDGAGAVASSLLKRENVKERMGALPSPVERVSQYAYFGGRVEMLRYGHTRETVYEADVRSAYPASAMQLPCLCCGHWSRLPYAGAWNDIPDSVRRSIDDRALCVALVEFNFPDEVMYPFPWRDEKSGSIYFPPKGRGYYWWPEVLAALAIFPGHVSIKHVWRYDTNCEHNPFNFIPRVYEQRAQWKRDGNGAEKAAKLAINACYGKLAQRVSAYGRPAFQSLAWAGWITSLLRARMFLAAWPVRENVVMIGTDSIFSTAPLDHLPESELIGEWEHTKYSGIVSVQAGFYWLFDYENPEQVAKRRTRGFHGKIDPKCEHKSKERCGCDPAMIARAWKRGDREYVARETIFVGMGQALAGDGIWQRWRTWHERDRVIDLYPTGKREPDYKDYKGAHRNLKHTFPVQPVTAMARQGSLSAPIELPPIDFHADHELERK